MDAAYTGSRGIKLNQRREFNMLPPEVLPMGTALQQQVPNPFFGIIQVGALAQRTVVRNQLLRPFPQYTGVASLNEGSANSIYHAMNLKLERRFSSGVGFLLAYTAGKLISDWQNGISGFGNPLDEGLNSTTQNWYNLRLAPMRLRRIEVWVEEKQTTLVFVTNHLKLAAATIAAIYKDRWQIGVSSQGHIVQSVEDRPRPKGSGLVAWEAPWRESKTTEPSDNMLRKEYAQRTRLQREVNADVASLHELPVAETVDNARKQQGLAETSPMRQLSPAGYQRRHGVKDDVETGEALGARRRNLVEEMPAITVSGKCWHRHQGGGSGRSTGDGRAAKRARREGPGPVSIPFVEARQG